MGRLIPAGTGLEFYRNFKLLTEAEPPQPEVYHAARKPSFPPSGAAAWGGTGGRGRGENAVEVISGQWSVVS